MFSVYDAGSVIANDVIVCVEPFVKAVEEKFNCAPLVATEPSIRGSVVEDASESPGRDILNHPAVPSAPQTPDHVSLPDLEMVPDTESPKVTPLLPFLIVTRLVPVGASSALVGWTPVYMSICAPLNAS